MEKDKLKGAIMGAVAGIVTGLLLAPKSGKETREDLRGILGKLREELADKLSEIKGITQENYNDKVEEVVDAYEKNKKISKKEAEEIKDALNEGFEKVKDKINKS